MIDKLKQLTKIKFVRLGNLIANVLNSKGSLYLMVISGILLYAPFAHVNYLNDSTKGIFGFKLMVSFLFALALPLVLISSGLVIRFIGSYTPNHIKNFANTLSFLVTASGMFFLVWTFSEIKDYTPLTYYSTILLLSVAFTFVISKIQTFIQKEEQILKTTLKAAKSLLNGVLGLFLDKYQYKVEDQNEFRDDIISEIENINYEPFRRHKEKAKRK